MVCRVIVNGAARPVADFVSRRPACRCDAGRRAGGQACPQGRAKRAATARNTATPASSTALTDLSAQEDGSAAICRAVSMRATCSTSTINWPFRDRHFDRMVLAARAW